LTTDHRSGFIQPGPQQRPLVLPSKISKARLRLQSQNERQARCRGLRKERLLEELALLDFEIPGDVLDDWEKWRIAANMYSACVEELSNCPRPLTRKDVLGKLIDKFDIELPGHILTKKRSFVQQEVVSGFSKL